MVLQKAEVASCRKLFSSNLPNDSRNLRLDHAKNSQSKTPALVPKNGCLNSGDVPFDFAPATAGRQGRLCALRALVICDQRIVNWWDSTVRHSMRARSAPTLRSAVPAHP